MEQNKTLNAYLLIVFIIFAIAFFVSFTFTYAQEDVGVTVSNTSEIDSTDKVPTTNAVRTNTPIKRKAVELKSKKLDVRTTLQEKRAELESKRENAKEKLEEKKAERAEKMEEKRAEKTKRLEERAKKRIDAYVERISKRLTVALERMDKIIGRVESRIAKLEEKFTDRGLDLSDAKRLLNEARDEVASAREDVSAVGGAIEGALNTDNPKESFSVIRELIKDAVASVKSAHRALVEAVKSVKASVEPNNTESSDDTTDTNEGDKIQP